ncbi:hypothetical protein GCM10027321_27390 [Massilia terrae]
MSTFLYPGFLRDKQEYAALRGFWTHHLLAAMPSDEPCEAYANDQFANGELFYDGNPIASAVNWRKQHAVRIIQQLSAEFGENYLSWTSEIQLQGPGQALPVAVTEKVIALTLTEKTLQRALTEIQQWLSEPSP